jgi:hypothetical protein
LLFYELQAITSTSYLGDDPNELFSPVLKNQKAELELFTWLGFELIYAVLSKRKQCFLQYLCLSKVETPILAEIILPFL